MDYKARMYNSTIGQFIQSDTLVSSPSSSQALNRYSYVENNPNKNTDASGYCITHANGSCYSDPNSGKEITYISRSGKSSGNGGLTISEAGKTFIENAENGNRGFYDDLGPGKGACTIGYGSVLHNSPCTGDEILTRTNDKGITGLYVASTIDPSVLFPLQSWGRNPDTGQIIWGLSKKDAKALMQGELNRDAVDINSILTVQLSQNQMDALLSFTYQTGFYTDLVTYDLNEGNYSGAVYDYIMKWTGKPVNPGLLNRRNQERQLFIGSDYDYYNDPNK